MPQESGALDSEELWKSDCIVVVGRFRPWTRSGFARRHLEQELGSLVWRQGWMDVDQESWVVRVFPSPVCIRMRIPARWGQHREKMGSKLLCPCLWTQSPRCLPHGHVLCSSEGWGMLTSHTGGPASLQTQLGYSTQPFLAFCPLPSGSWWIWPSGTLGCGAEGPWESLLTPRPLWAHRSSLGQTVIYSTSLLQRNLQFNQNFLIVHEF